jgi:hypothetical protein
MRRAAKPGMSIPIGIAAKPLLNASYKPEQKDRRSRKAAEVVAQAL